MQERSSFRRLRNRKNFTPPSPTRSVEGDFKTKIHIIAGQQADRVFRGQGPDALELPYISELYGASRHHGGRWPGLDGNP